MPAEEELACAAAAGPAEELSIDGKSGPLAMPLRDLLPRSAMLLPRLALKSAGMGA